MHPPVPSPRARLRFAVKPGHGQPRLRRRAAAESGGPVATGPRGARGQERWVLRCSLPNPTMPDPVGQPDCGSTGTSTCGCGPCFTGLGDTDWTLSALQTAAASLTGPITWLLVG